MKLFFGFLGLILATFFAEVLCYFVLSDGYWSWRTLYGACFQALLLFWIVPLCKNPRRLFAILLFVEFELLFIDALKIRILGTALTPGDFYLFPEFLRLLPTLPIYKIAGFCALLLALPLTWAAGGYVFWKMRQRPTRLELLTVLPLLAVAVWLFAFPGNYRNTLARFIGNEPTARLIRGETYGRILSLSMEFAGDIQDFEYHPSRAEVAFAQEWFKARSGPHPDMKLNRRNVYILLVESFWNPANLVAPPLIAGKSFPYLAPRFLEAWTANGSSHLFSPVYGGGTANTEFELLCGMPASSAGDGLIFLQSLAKDLACLPRLFRNQGYRSFAFHANIGEYYDRVDKFPAIGFERFFTIADFKKDVMIGPFLSDKSFIAQSLELARKNSAGKPFLAYLMTMAGHWPYPWSNIYPHPFQLNEKNDSTDEMARQLNINFYTSELIAETLTEIAKDDPSGLVVVAGDHLPPTALWLSVRQGNPQRFLTDPIWFETPLLIVDGKTKIASGPLAAFEVGNQIMDRIGIPWNARGQFQYFGRVNSDLIRPVVPDKIFELRPKNQFSLCTTTSPESLCKDSVEWFKNARAISVDLTRGSGFAR